MLCVRMERQNRPPPLTLPSQPPSFLSAYQRMSATDPLPVWAPGHNRRRGNLRRSFVSLSNPTALTLVALFVITGALTWLLVHGTTTTANTSSPLSQLPD